MSSSVQYLYRILFIIGFFLPFFTFSLDTRDEQSVFDSLEEYLANKQGSGEERPAPYLPDPWPCDGSREDASCVVGWGVFSSDVLRNDEGENYRLDDEQSVFDSLEEYLANKQGSGEERPAPYLPDPWPCDGSREDASCVVRWGVFSSDLLRNDESENYRLDDEHIIYWSVQGSEEKPAPYLPDPWPCDGSREDAPCSLKWNIVSPSYFENFYSKVMDRNFVVDGLGGGPSLIMD